jgi:hypothetical protein
VVLQRPRLGQVLLDGRQLFEARSRAGRGGLLRAVLEELLPVDFPNRLLRRFGVSRPGVDAGLLEILIRQRLGAFAVFAAPSLGLVVLQDRVVVELLANLVDELQSRQLQQTYRLLQLGSHHQLLGQA